LIFVKILGCYTWVFGTYAFIQNERSPLGEIWMVFVAQCWCTSHHHSLWFIIVHNCVHVHIITNNFLYTNLFSKPFNRDNIDVIHRIQLVSYDVRMYVCVYDSYKVPIRILYTLSKKGKKIPIYFQRFYFVIFYRFVSVSYHGNSNHHV